jgi:23S rRNA-/tRNA-specific pseudouridylate synthase
MRLKPGVIFVLFARWPTDSEATFHGSQAQTHRQSMCRTCAYQASSSNQDTRSRPSSTSSSSNVRNPVPVILEHGQQQKQAPKGQVHTHGKKQPLKHNSIRYVDWKGTSGILQNYRNVMNKEECAGWLRKPLPTSSRSWQEEQKEQEEIPSRPPTWSRQGKQIFAEYQPAKPLDPTIHLQPIYIDSRIVVVNKELGALSVPGPNRKPSTAVLVHAYFGNDEADVDKTIVHRLDMDTSGVICYARSKAVLSILHEAFRAKSAVERHGGG